MSSTPPDRLPGRRQPARLLSISCPPSRRARKEQL